MNWKLFPQAASLPNPAARPTRFRPQLDRLEDRTLLTLHYFFLDDPSSVLTLSGTVAGVPIEEQGSGSLMTTYGGVVEADFDLSGGTIGFSPNSYAIANNSGDWQPLPDGSPGSAPAAYGGQLDFLGRGLAAVRDLMVSAFTDGSAPLSDGGGGAYYFPSTQTLAIYTGTAAFNHPLLGGGMYDISNNATPNEADSGVLFDLGDGSFYLYAPISVTLRITIPSPVGDIPIVFNIRGEIQGIGYAGDSPSPGTGGGQTPDAVAAGVALAGQSAARVFAPPLSAGATSVPEPEQVDTLVPVRTETATAVVASSAAPSGQAPLFDPAILDLIWNPGVV